MTLNLFNFIVLSVVAASFCACDSSPSTGNSNHEIPPPLIDNDAGVIFDNNELVTFELTVTPDDWDQLNKHIVEEIYVPARLSYSGYDVGKVGLRYKGSVGTLESCVDKNGKQICPKLSMKIKFNKYDKNKRFYGLKRLNFHSLMYDPSLMHDRLAYKMFRDMNVDAPRATHARLKINDKYMGVFSLVEQIDGRFTDNRFSPKGNGNLYKELWPTSKDAHYYDKGLKTNKESANHKGMIAFYAALSNASDAELVHVLETYADVKQLMRYLAVDSAILNWDGITAWYTENDYIANHNFYWYQLEGKNYFQLIPWDLDNTFSLCTGFRIVPAWDNLNVDCDKIYSVFDGEASVKAPACDPLMRAIALAAKSEYPAAVKQLIDGPFNLDTIFADIERWSKQIEDGVNNDLYGPGLEAWRDAVDSLKHELTLLHLRLKNTANGMPKPKPLELSINEVNDFETCDALEFALGALSYSNNRSSFSFRRNTDSPIDGLADTRINFEYRNEYDDPETGAWLQWGMSKLYFENMEPVDFSAAKITSIELTVKADTNRSLRVEFGSPLQSQGSEGICFGWTLNLSPDTKTFTLNLDDATFPDWVTKPPKENLKDIITEIEAISFIPEPKGVSSDGLFHDGKTDPGWIQIDDIIFKKTTLVTI